MARRGRPPHPDILTPREWEVLAFLREGLSNPEIAGRLGISRDGVKFHVSEILGKLGLSSREEAAAWRREEHRPWWATVAVPVTFLWRRASALPVGVSSVAMALAVAVFAAALAGLGLIAILLMRSDGDGDETPAPAFGAPLDIPARPEQNVLYVIDEDGSGLRELATGDSLWDVQWSPSSQAMTRALRSQS
jgi:DNA-binding CsgD family transcriptional regulator